MRWGESWDSEEERVELGERRRDGEMGMGVRLSSVMVMRRAKESGVLTKVLKVSCRADDAEGVDHRVREGARGIKFKAIGTYR